MQVKWVLMQDIKVLKTLFFKLLADKMFKLYRNHLTSQKVSRKFKFSNKSIILFKRNSNLL